MLPRSPQGSPTIRRFLCLALLAGVLVAWMLPTASTAALGAAAGPAAGWRDTTETSTSRDDAARRADTWRERYARKFVTRVQHRDWGWVRRQGGSELVRSARAMEGRRGLRVVGRCYPQPHRGAWCDLSNYYALTFFRRPSGAIRVTGLFVQD